MGLLTDTVVTGGIAEGGDDSRQVNTEVQLTKLIVLGVLALGFGAFALALYLTKHPTAGGSMLAIVTAILGSGFGVAVGEKSGSQDAAKALGH
jgi:hypothetical protein